MDEDEEYEYDYGSDQDSHYDYGSDQGETDAATGVGGQGGGGTEIFIEIENSFYGINVYIFYISVFGNKVSAAF